MVNQVSGPFGFDVNNIGFPNVQSNDLPTQGVQSDGMIQNLVSTPLVLRLVSKMVLEIHPLVLHMLYLAILLVVFFYSKILPLISLNVPFLQLNVNNCSPFSKGMQVQVQVLGLQPVMLLLS